MRLAILCALSLSACTSFPALEGTVSDAARAAPYPRLMPLPALPQATGDETVILQARADALRVRAAMIRRNDIAALQ